MQTISDSIIGAAMRLEGIANKHIFSHIDITSASIKIMCVLLKCPSANTPGGILEAIGGTKSNISQRLAFLEKNGFIKRKHADAGSDKRKVTICLTPKGKKKLLEAEKLIQKANMYLEKHFTNEELASHFAFFKKLNDILNKEENKCNLQNNL